MDNWPLLEKVIEVLDRGGAGKPEAKQWLIKHEYAALTKFGVAVASNGPGKPKEITYGNRFVLTTEK